MLERIPDTGRPDVIDEGQRYRTGWHTCLIAGMGWRYPAVMGVCVRRACVCLSMYVVVYDVCEYDACDTLVRGSSTSLPLSERRDVRGVSKYKINAGVE